MKLVWLTNMYGLTKSRDFVYIQSLTGKMSTSKFGNIKLAHTVFMLCDMQERFRPAINYFPEIISVAKKLLQGSKLLDIPLIVTEQYPKGLGSTVEELQADLAHGSVFPKTVFSMVLPEVEKKLESLCEGDVKHVVLFGIEAHVCVQQTVIDLLERGFDVHVVADATSSRNQPDRLIAFQRFRHSGAFVTTSEAILLQLIGTKDHPQFKAIQGLIKESAPDTGLVTSVL